MPHRPAHDDTDPGHSTLERDLAHLRLRQSIADLPRRRSLQRLAGAGLASLLPASMMSACGGGGDAGTASGAGYSSGATTSGSSSSTGSTSSGTCSVIPSETNGPYPADGTTALNALTLSGIVRSDITRSLSGTQATASGVPLTLTLKLVDTSCAPLAGYAVYVWHCDAAGGYSMYSTGLLDESYLRGVQASDSAGSLTFRTIFPGCYAGRWPHIHFEIYRSTMTATSRANALKITQLALPQDICTTVYTNAASAYPKSLTNLNAISLNSDNVFADGYATQMASVDGSVAGGYTATLQVGIG